MIDFQSIENFALEEQESLLSWISFVIDQEKLFLGEICFVYCDDEYLLNINIKYLKHNTLTDIISFDYSLDKVISGDVFISIDRVTENAKELGLLFRDELHRVMVHGILHFCGYLDKSNEEKKLMRSKEDYYLSLRTF